VSVRDLLSGEFVVDLAAAAVKKIRNRPKAVARRAAKAARKAARQRQPDEAAGEFFQSEEETTMLEGKKTWIGIGLMGLGLVLSAFGIGECAPEAIAAAACVPADTIIANVGEAADKIITGIGLLVAAGGAAHKQVREKRLKEALEQK
jgi:hypothetical protein